MNELFLKFINEYKNSLQNTRIQKNETLHELLLTTKNELLSPLNFPSSALHEAIKKLELRTNEPMKVAITGQFSSGKSTFLNALLAKNILPTGITPVTSKVNYIKYGDNFSMKVSFYDGREAFYSVDDIATFTDQRAQVEDIAYLTIYAPLTLLKDVVFIDTPGLNSQAQSDTKTTQTVLKEVDGIIWLTLIDNAGKMSEAETLEEYLHAYQNKSLCVLNQKDKFTSEQVEQTRTYIKSAFSKYFNEVIAISAKDALLSRSNECSIMLENELAKMLNCFEKEIKSSNYLVQKDSLLSCFEIFEDKSKEILKNDSKENIQLLKSSNINAVLEYIYKEIQPQANSSKEFAIKKDVKKLCQNLIRQEEKIAGIFTNLENILDEFEIFAQKKFEELKKSFSDDLNLSFLKIIEIIEKIASEIISHVTYVKRVRFEKDKKLLFSKKESFNAYYYEAIKINSDEVYKKLFYSDNLIGKMFKQYLLSLKAIQDNVNLENLNVYCELEKSIKAWQKPNELVRKELEVESDIQFANLRKFASKVYENILKPYNDEICSSFAKISSEFNHVGSALSFNYQNATEVVIAFLEQKIEHSVKLYEDNPTQFRIFEPKLEEIKERLKTSFHLYELENLMLTKKSFVSNNYEKLIIEFAKIKKNRVQLLNEHKKEYLDLKIKFENFLKII